MMNKKLIALILPIFMIISIIIYEIIMKATGVPVIFVASGYDPRDLLRGHYIEYTIDEEGYMDEIEFEYLRTQQDMDKYATRIEGYVSLVDNDGDGIFDGIGAFHSNKPSTPYLECTCRLYYSVHNSNDVSISLNSISRKYYVNEKLAPILEKQIDLQGEFYISGTVNNGVFRADGMIINGVTY